MALDPTDSSDLEAVTGTTEGSAGIDLQGTGEGMMLDGENAAGDDPPDTADEGSPIVFQVGIGGGGEIDGVQGERSSVIGRSGERCCDGSLERTAASGVAGAQTERIESGGDESA